MQYTLGRIGIMAYDRYDPMKTYEALDLVPYQGGSYIAKCETQGNPPVDTEYWVQITAPNHLNLGDWKMAVEPDGSFGIYKEEANA